MIKQTINVIESASKTDKANRPPDNHYTSQ